MVDASCTARAPRLRANPRAALNGRKEILILGKGRARPLPRCGEGAAGGAADMESRAGPRSAPHPPFPAPSSSPRRPSPRSSRQQPARCRPPPRSSALLAPPGGGCGAVRRLGFRPGAPRAPEFLPAGAPGRGNIAESREHHRAVPKAALRPRVQRESSSSELPQ